MKLTIELVPTTSWYTNVRSNVSGNTWNKIRKKCYDKAGHKCEVCGSDGIKQGRKHKVECHEIWQYDDDNHNQKLTGFIALCPKCHQVKHIGLAYVKGYMENAIKHFKKVNKIGWDEAVDYIEKVFKIHSERSQFEWEVDTSYVDEYLTNTETLF